MNKPHTVPMYWDVRYRTGSDSWDLGTPTPVFARLLKEKKFRPGRLAVVGCGKGYDAVLFADAGFTVTGFDFSREALQKAKSVAAAAGVSVEFIQENILALPPRFVSAFDYVLEYVTYCAIDPGQRPLFASAVASILRPGGVLIALLFPLGEYHGGPPFEISIRATRELFARHLTLVSGEVPEDSVRPRKGREWLSIWKKE